MPQLDQYFNDKYYMCGFSIENYERAKYGFWTRIVSARSCLLRLDCGHGPGMWVNKWHRGYQSSLTRPSTTLSSPTTTQTYLQITLCHCLVPLCRTLYWDSAHLLPQPLNGSIPFWRSLSNIPDVVKFVLSRFCCFCSNSYPLILATRNYQWMEAYLWVWRWSRSQKIFKNLAKSWSFLSREAIHTLS